MIPFTTVALLGAGLYALFILFILTGLRRLRPTQHITSVLPFVSVVIAARNEEKNLSQLLSALTDQTYPPDRYEVLVSDDRSTDNTWAIIERYTRQHGQVQGIRITDLVPDMTPKKRALTQAIWKAKGEIILSTDGDCVVPNTWIASMVQALGTTAGLCVGFSTTTSDGSLLQNYQRVDFLALMTANAGVIGHGLAWSGSGQNIAYRTEAFEKINGFIPCAHRLSGDDVYLVQAISRIAPVTFNSDPGSFVRTNPKESLGEFLQQRIRWASNSRGLETTKPLFLLFLISAFISNTAIIPALFFPVLRLGTSLILLVKLILEGSVIFFGARQFRVPLNVRSFAVWALLQPLYIPVVGVMGFIGKFRWK